MKLPPLPKWNKTTDDIDSAEFIRSSLDYERSLLPPDLVFPRVGQIWETLRDCDVHFQAWFTVKGTHDWFPQPLPLVTEILQSGQTVQLFPHFAAGRIALKQGERVRIHALDDTNRPLQVIFVPLRYDELHQTVVPDEQRRRRSHYVLTLRTAYTACCSREETQFFHQLFGLVEDLA